jgi:Putative lumazine-binding
MTEQDQLEAGPADAFERAAVQACIADYCEGYAGGDKERMEKSLHPLLVKRRIEAEGITTLDAPYMVRAAAKRHADGTAEPNVAWTIESIDIWHGMASAVVVTPQFLDYLHLGKFHDGWKVVNVLWTRV